MADMASTLEEGRHHTRGNYTSYSRKLHVIFEEGISTDGTQGVLKSLKLFHIRLFKISSHAIEIIYGVV